MCGERIERGNRAFRAAHRQPPIPVDRISRRGACVALASWSRARWAFARTTRASRVVSARSGAVSSDVSWPYGEDLGLRNGVAVEGLQPLVRAPEG